MSSEKLNFFAVYYTGDVLTFLPIKTAGTPRLPQLTPQMPTYPSSGKIGGEIIKLYQSRCFYIKNRCGGMQDEVFRDAHGDVGLVFRLVPGAAAHGVQL